MLKKLLVFVVIICIVFIYYKTTCLKFNLNVDEVYSIEYYFDNYSRNGFSYNKGEIYDKEIINKTVKYLNNLSLPKSFTKTKGATQSLCFKDKDGNKINGYAFGCGDL